MLGHNNARLNQLEATNRVLRAELLAQTLRAELLAQTLRAEALAGIVRTLQQENEAHARHIANMAATTQHATQQAQAGRGVDIAEPVIERFVWN